MSGGLVEQRQGDVDIAAGGVGVRADDVCALDQGLRLLAVHARQADAQFDFDAETVGDRADPYDTFNRGVCCIASLSRPATNFIAPIKQAE